MKNTDFEYNPNNSHKDIYVNLFKNRAECNMKSKKYNNAIKDYEILVKLTKSRFCMYIKFHNIFMFVIFSKLV